MGDDLNTWTDIPDDEFDEDDDYALEGTDIPEDGYDEDDGYNEYDNEYDNEYEADEVRVLQEREADITGDPGEDIEKNIKSVRNVIKGKQQYYAFENTADAQQGSGKQSRVFLCQGVRDKKEYAVKLYDYKNIKLDELQSVLGYLEKEKHPNVTNVLEHGECRVLGGKYYYVIMNVYYPINKGAFLWRNQDNDAYRKRIMKFLDDMNEALRFIHKNDTFHGDIKPANIMVDSRTNKYVLIDFGGSARIDGDFESSVSAVALTYHYAPPEVTRGRHHINEYSDYYCLGGTLLELMVGGDPTREDKITKRFGGVKNIYSYRIPANISNYYENLLRGLLYQDQDEDKERIKEYRWASIKVDEWLGLIRKKRFDEAASRNNVPKGFVDVAEQRGERVRKWDFGTTLNLEIGPEDNEKQYFFDNLTQMADDFFKIEVWDEAVELFLRDDPDDDPFDAVKADVRSFIRKGIDKMKRAASGIEPGLSINAEFLNSC